MDYKEEDFLQLSGLQHFMFCKRQWALIHIENQWEENLRTVEGALIHEKVHNAGNREKRGDMILYNAMRVNSPSLGISGECDRVEFFADPDGITLWGYEGLWSPYPIEYKRGHSKISDYDRAQLCAQAMCLEEMLSCKINEGALYYQETRHREIVIFSEELRNTVKNELAEMHSLMKKQHTPKVKPQKKCKNCSLYDICMPTLVSTKDVDQYIDDLLGKK